MGQSVLLFYLVINWPYIWGFKIWREGDIKKCFIMHLKVTFKIDVFMQKMERLEPATAAPNRCALQEQAGLSSLTQKRLGGLG